MTSLINDVRYSLRMMGKNPAVTIVAVLTLALGIGASTTVFGWIDTVLLHPVSGVANPGELIAFETETPNGQFVPTSYPDYRDYRDNLRYLAGLAMFRPTALNVGEGEQIERVWGEMVSGNYFNVLGVRPFMGRVFLPAEFGDKPNGFPVAVISQRLWRTHFNSDPAIIGKTIHVNRQPLTIVGVAPQEFHGGMAGTQSDLWVPYMMQPELQGVGEWMLRDRKTRNLLGIARLKPGISRAWAQGEVSSLAGIMSRAQPYEDGGMKGTLLPLWKTHFGPQGALLGPLQILMAICCVVMLIVCANVANLLLARFTARHKEFSVRLALGASRGRLARQVLTEGFVLSLAGALVGLLLARWLGNSLTYLLPRDLPVSLDVPLNARIFAFAVGACVVTALISGFAPALQAARANLNDALKESGRSTEAATHSQRMRAMLVVLEVSLALMALIGAGLFVRGFRTASRIQPAFDADNVLLSHFYLTTSGYNLQQRKEFCLRLRREMEQQPGVTAVAYSDGVPLSFEPSWWEDLRIKGYVPAPNENMKIYRNVVSPGYFNLLRIPLLDGRDFTEQDDEQSHPVMIVNESFVHRFLGEGNPLGRQVYGWGTWFTVVGVVKDSKYNLLTESQLPYFYVPFRQVYRADMALGFYVRTAGDLMQATAALRRTVRQIDPNVAIFDILPLKEIISSSLYPQRVAASMLSALGLLALLLAAVGLYSVMAYSVTQRTHEIGVRMALGARPQNVLAMVVRQGLKLTAAGLGIGVVAALLLSSRLSLLTLRGSTMGGGGQLLRSSATDPLIYMAAALFLSLVAALASYIPARRATRVDPMIALRYE